MSRFIVLSFAFMGLAFYELSGGADFQPGTHTTAEALGIAPRSAKATQFAGRVDPSETVGPRSSIAQQSASVKPESAVDSSVKTTRLVARAQVNRPGIILASLESPTVAGPATGLIKASLSAPSRPALASGGKAAPAPQLAEEKPADIRQIDGSRVNMRSGPSTRHTVLRKLGSGDRVEVLEDNGSGWLKLRVVGSDRIGWIADFLVTASAD